MTIQSGEFELSTDPSRLDVQAIHTFLAKESYWARNIPLAVLQRSMANSICFGIYTAGQQVGFARVISDQATMAYLGDVFILPAYRGQGLSKWLLGNIMAHPDLQGLRRWILLTGDAHGLYEQFGWSSIADPGKWMEVHRPDVYREQ